MSEDLKPIIAARVRAARKAKTMTQAELADRVSRTVEAISNLERGLSLPPLDLLQAIGRVLDVTLGQLVEPAAGDGQPTERVRLEMEIMSAAKALPLPLLRVAARQIVVMQV